jgi:hypothetical protein
MELTRDNYYTPAADWAYMSCSQFQSWNECEARELAILEGRWTPKETEALIVGNYFHSYFESPVAHEQFIFDHEDVIFKKQTKAQAAAGIREKFAPYVKADEMIAVAEADPLIKSLIDMPGENEKIVTGTLFGVPWRARYDKYVAAGRLIIDWKTVADISELKWSDKYHEKVTFIDQRDYMMRAAVYSELEKQLAGSSEDPAFVIVAISKQDPPDKEALMLNHRSRYDWELEQIKDRLPYIQRIKDGSVKPRRCGCCDYCRATKQLMEIRPYYQLMPEYRTFGEDGFAGTMLPEEGDDDGDSGTGQMLGDTQTPGDVDALPAVRSSDNVGEALGRDVQPV